MGLASYISGKQRKTTKQTYDEMARKAYKKLGYDKAMEYWQGVLNSKAEDIKYNQYGEKLEGEGMFGRQVAQGLIKSSASGIVKRLKNLHTQTSPRPRQISGAESSARLSVSRRAKRRKGYASTIATRGGLGIANIRKARALGV